MTTQVGNLEEARRAEAAEVDFIVARGREGGGHGRDDLGTLALLQIVLDGVSVPVVAAGGVATAGGLSAVLGRRRGRRLGRDGLPVLPGKRSSCCLP